MLALTACHKTTDTFTIESEVQPRPARMGPLKVSLRVLDSSARPVDGAHIELEGDMTHAGMAPVFGTTKALGNGRYRGSLQLSMGGDWIILVHGRLANGTVLEREIVVK